VHGDGRETSVWRWVVARESPEKKSPRRGLKYLTEPRVGRLDALLQRGLHAGEGRIEARAHALHNRDDRN
jgi:hypothetical protein